MKTIPLTQGKEALVDGCDYDWLMQWKWHYSKGKYGGYAARGDYIEFGRKHRIILMHVEIMRHAGRWKTGDVDHRDQNKLNNQKSNLRMATLSQQGANKPPQRNNTSGYKGVCWIKCRRKWKAYIKVNGTQYHLKYCDTKEEAAGVYDEAAKLHFGEFAYLNFPEVQIC